MPHEYIYRFANISQGYNELLDCKMHGLVEIARLKLTPLLFFLDRLGSASLKLFGQEKFLFNTVKIIFQIPIITQRLIF